MDLLINAIVVGLLALPEAALVVYLVLLIVRPVNRFPLSRIATQVGLQPPPGGLPSIIEPLRRPRIVSAIAVVIGYAVVVWLMAHDRHGFSAAQLPVTALILLALTWPPFVSDWRGLTAARTNDFAARLSRPGRMFDYVPPLMLITVAAGQAAVIAAIVLAVSQPGVTNYLEPLLPIIVFSGAGLVLTVGTLVAVALSARRPQPIASRLDAMWADALRARAYFGVLFVPLGIDYLSMNAISTRAWLPFGAPERVTVGVFDAVEPFQFGGFIGVGILLLIISLTSASPTKYYRKRLWPAVPGILDSPLTFSQQLHRNDAPRP